MADNTWITEGARVAVLSGTHTAHIRYATVERLTKTQAILDNGERFRLDNLRKVGESGYDRSKLREPTDPYVVEVAAERRRSNAIYDVIGKAEALRNKDANVQIDLLDQLAAAVSVARDAVAFCRDLSR